MNDNFTVSSTQASLDVWIKILEDELVEPIHGSIQRIFEKARETATAANDPMQYLIVFQRYLKAIPEWSESMLDAELDYLRTKRDMTHLPTLITTVCAVYLRVMAAAKADPKPRRISVTMPDMRTFLHRVYRVVGDTLYRAAYLFELLPVDQSLLQQQHYFKIHGTIRECIGRAVRDSFPAKTILDMLTNPVDQVEEQVTTEILGVAPAPPAVPAVTPVTPLVATPAPVPPAAAPVAVPVAAPVAAPVAVAPAPAPSEPIFAPIAPTPTDYGRPETPTVPTYMADFDDNW